MSRGLGDVYKRQAEYHPDRVLGLALAGITMTRPSEIDWLYRGMSSQLPAEWERFAAVVDGQRGDVDIVEAYRQRLEMSDSLAREEAAIEWENWERAVMGIDPVDPSELTGDDVRWMVPFARIVTHYFAHDAWLAPDQILTNAHRLDGVPAVLIHGTSDRASRIETARELSAVWKSAVLVEVEGEGHGISEPAMANAIVDALGGLASVSSLSPEPPG